MRAGQRLQQTGKVAAGIDHPFGPGRLELANQALQLPWHGWIFKLGKKRSIEIGGNDFERQIHTCKPSPRQSRSLLRQKLGAPALWRKPCRSIFRRNKVLEPGDGTRRHTSTAQSPAAFDCSRLA